MRAIIIGNSAAGLATAKSFRKYAPSDEIIIISKEGGLAYSRVLLPYILRKKLPYERLFIRDASFYTDNQIKYIENEVTSIDTQAKKLTLHDATELTYDALIIASGSYAVAPPIEGIRQDGVYHMWTKSDLDKLIPLFDTKKKAVVIGSGFVSLQGAWAAKSRGLQVDVIEIMDRIMPNVLDIEGAAYITKKIAESGVVLHTSTVTQKIEACADGTLKVHLKDKDALIADFIIVGTGVRCAIDFLEGSEIMHDRAILVDDQMRTNIEGVFAAGDVAAGPTTFGLSHQVHALWPTALEMGEIAGANAAGKAISYKGSLNMNVTQMFNVTVASIGLFNESEIDTSYTFDVNKEGGYLKVCYKDGYVVGACLVGSSESVKLFGKLRTLIRKKIKTDCLPEKLESYLDCKIFADRA